MSDGVVLFNENVLFEKYKDIVRVCIGDGYVLPYLIKVYNIPVEYRFGDKELRGLYKSMDAGVRGRLDAGLMSRRRRELDIVRGVDGVFDCVYDFHCWELMEFVRVYSGFRSILL